VVEKAATAAPVVAAPAPVVVGEAVATIKLGQINERLSPIQITAAGLAELGFQPVGKEKAAVLYAESQFPRICVALINHIQGAVALA